MNAGESYAGIYIPLLAQNLLTSNQANASVFFNLQVGNHCTVEGTYASQRAGSAAILSISTLSTLQISKYAQDANWKCTAATIISAAWENTSLLSAASEWQLCTIETIAELRSANNTYSML